MDIYICIYTHIYMYIDTYSHMHTSYSYRLHKKLKVCAMRADVT